MGITGLILTKLDGSARGGCVVSFNFNHSMLKATIVVRRLTSFLQVSVVDELGIPVKFVGVGEGVEDLQPFDAEAFVTAIFS